MGLNVLAVAPALVVRHDARIPVRRAMLRKRRAHYCSATLGVDGPHLIWALVHRCSAAGAMGRSWRPRARVNGGIYGYPATAANPPHGKLRLLYEAAPMA